MKNPLNLKLKTEWPALLAVILSVSLSFYFYANFPDRIATHWNFAGEVDGWSGKSFGAFFFPALIAGMYLLFLLLPMFDPKKDRYQEFVKPYNIFRQAIIIVLSIVYLATGFFNIGYDINIGAITGGSIGIMMIILGNYLGKIKPNWFVGIRTPWTMSSENVWTKTHRVGGYLFMVFGVILMIAPFMPETMALIFFFTWTVFLLVFTFGYSYWLYRKEKKN